MNAAHEAGLREVRLIHGRGKGVQRGIVQQALERHPLVVEFWDAPESTSARRSRGSRRKDVTSPPNPIWASFADFDGRLGTISASSPAGTRRAGASA